MQATNVLQKTKLNLKQKYKNKVKMEKYCIKIQ